MTAGMMYKSDDQAKKLEAGMQRIEKSLENQRLTMDAL
jgi:hypothetical protein